MGIVKHLTDFMKHVGRVMCGTVSEYVSYWFCIYGPTFLFLHSLVLPSFIEFFCFLIDLSSFSKKQ